MKLKLKNNTTKKYEVLRDKSDQKYERLVMLKNKEHSWEKLKKIQINGDICCFWVRQLNIVKRSNLPIFPAGIFVEIDNLIPKFI